MLDDIAELLAINVDQSASPPWCRHIIGGLGVAHVARPYSLFVVADVNGEKAVWLLPGFQFRLKIGTVSVMM